jgi:hypothetical protein
MICLFSQNEGQHYGFLFWTFFGSFIKDVTAPMMEASKEASVGLSLYALGARTLSVILTYNEGIYDCKNMRPSSRQI